MGLKINATKTKLMSMGTKHGDGVFIAGERIKEVDEFKFLGSTVSKKGGTDEGTSRHALGRRGRHSRC